MPNDMQGNLSPAEAVLVPPIAEFDIEYRIAGHTVGSTIAVYGRKYMWPGEPPTLQIERVELGGVDITGYWEANDKFRTAVRDQVFNANN